MNLGKRLAEGQGAPETQLQVKKDTMTIESQFEAVEKTDKEARRQKKAEV